VDYKNRGLLALLVLFFPVFALYAGGKSQVDNPPSRYAASGLRFNDKVFFIYVENDLSLCLDFVDVSTTKGKFRENHDVLIEKTDTDFKLYTGMDSFFVLNNGNLLHYDVSFLNSISNPLPTQEMKKPEVFAHDVVKCFLYKETILYIKKDGGISLYNINDKENYDFEQSITKPEKYAFALFSEGELDGLHEACDSWSEKLEETIIANNFVIEEKERTLLARYLRIKSKKEQMETGSEEETEEKAMLLYKTIDEWLAVLKTEYTRADTLREEINEKKAAKEAEIARQETVYRGKLRLSSRDNNFSTDEGILKISGNEVLASAKTRHFEGSDQNIAFLITLYNKTIDTYQKLPSGDSLANDEKRILEKFFDMLKKELRTAIDGIPLPDLNPADFDIEPQTWELENHAESFAAFFRESIAQVRTDNLGGSAEYDYLFLGKKGEAEYVLLYKPEGERMEAEKFGTLGQNMEQMGMISQGNKKYLYVNENNAVSLYDPFTLERETGSLPLTEKEIVFILDRTKNIVICKDIKEGRYSFKVLGFSQNSLNLEEYRGVLASNVKNDASINFGWPFYSVRFDSGVGLVYANDNNKAGKRKFMERKYSNVEYYYIQIPTGAGILVKK
jgi:hypothetical protein